MKSIYVSKKVETSIKALRKNGKTGINLASKAKMIIDDLASGAVQRPDDVVGTTTKYGEKRIKNCYKYDLGCGYRLVTVHRGETVFISFLGTHDSCQRWLETNSRLKNFAVGSGRKISITDTRQRKASSIERECENKKADDDPSNHLTDKELLFVFSGLAQSMKKQEKLARE